MSEKLKLALHYLEEGNRLHREGDIEGAIESYRRSIVLHPTAEAHTYLGWMYSFQGRLQEAIEQCRIAIELDPDFGNPYNDIGVYLMEMGREEEAEEWFRRAMRAPRYEPRHFPHLNLARLYLRRGQHGKALGEYRRALELAPQDPQARAAFLELVSRLN